MNSSTGNVLLLGQEKNNISFFGQKTNKNSARSWHKENKNKRTKVSFFHLSSIILVVIFCLLLYAFSSAALAFLAPASLSP